MGMGTGNGNGDRDQEWDEEYKQGPGMRIGPVSWFRANWVGNLQMGPSGKQTQVVPPLTGL